MRATAIEIARPECINNVRLIVSLRETASRISVIMAGRLRESALFFREIGMDWPRTDFTRGVFFNRQKAVHDENNGAMPTRVRRNGPVGNKGGESFTCAERRFRSRPERQK